MDNLKMNIREILKELNFQKKEILGSGGEHKVYSSSKFPDRLFKVGRKKSVEEWIEIFQSNPNLFPIVYKIGQFKKNENLFFVMIEKLDTKKAIDEWDYLHEKMEELDIIDDDDNGLYGTDLYDIYINYGGSDGNSVKFKIIEDILEKLKNYDNKAFNIFSKWFKLIKDCEKIKEKILGRPTRTDAHKYNFGYSKDGKLKCLDI